MEGRFLERGAYKNESRNGEFFNPFDFLVGNVLKINGYVFEILEIDEFS